MFVSAIILQRCFGKPRPFKPQRNDTKSSKSCANNSSITHRDVSVAHDVIDPLSGEPTPMPRKRIQIAALTLGVGALLSLGLLTPLRSEGLPSDYEYWAIEGRAVAVSEAGLISLLFQHEDEDRIVQVEPYGLEANAEALGVLVLERDLSCRIMMKLPQSISAVCGVFYEVNQDYCLEGTHVFCNRNMAGISTYIRNFDLGRRDCDIIESALERAVEIHPELDDDVANECRRLAE